jgi:hypothetical protein
MINRLLKSTFNKHETLHCQKRSGEPLYLEMGLRSPLFCTQEYRVQKYSREPLIC